MLGLILQLKTWKHMSHFLEFIFENASVGSTLVTLKALEEKLRTFNEISAKARPIEWLIQDPVKHLKWSVLQK